MIPIGFSVLQQFIGLLAQPPTYSLYTNHEKLPPWLVQVPNARFAKQWH